MRRPVSGFARCFVDCVRLPSGIALCILAAALGANAQQPAPAQQQQAPAEQQQTPPQAPAVAPAGGTQLPQIVVNAPKPKTKPKPKPGAGAPQRVAEQTDAPTAAQAALDAKMNALDEARNNLLPKIGASTYTITRQAIVDMPQGDNTPIDKVILQMPGVSYDSAVSNPNFHVRNASPASSISPAEPLPHRAATSAFMAAATRRSRQASITAAASAIRNISSPRAAIGTPSGWRIRPRAPTPSTITPSKANSSAMSRRCSTNQPG